MVKKWFDFPSMESVRFRTTHMKMRARCYGCLLPSMKSTPSPSGRSGQLCFVFASGKGCTIGFLYWRARAENSRPNNFSLIGSRPVQNASEEISKEKAVNVEQSILLSIQYSLVRRRIFLSVATRSRCPLGRHLSYIDNACC